MSRTTGAAFRRAAYPPGPGVRGSRRDARSRRAAAAASRSAAAAASAAESSRKPPCPSPYRARADDPGAEADVGESAFRAFVFPAGVPPRLREENFASDPPTNASYRSSSVSVALFVRLSCLALASGVATSRVRPPPPPRPTPTGRRPSSTLARVAGRGASGSVSGGGGARDVPNAIRASAARVTLFFAPPFVVSSSAARASADAAAVLLPSRLRRDAIARGSASRRSGASLRTSTPSGAAARTVNACAANPPPSLFPASTRHSSPNSAGATRAPRNTSSSRGLSASAISARAMEPRTPPPTPSPRSSAGSLPRNSASRALAAASAAASSLRRATSRLARPRANTSALPPRTKNTPAAASPARTMASPGEHA